MRKDNRHEDWDSVFHSKPKKKKKTNQKIKRTTENKSTESSTYQVEGLITQSFPNAMFRACLETNQKDEILVYICGKMRKHNKRIMLGDRVLITIEKTDIRKGRIIRRLS